MDIPLVFPHARNDWYFRATLFEVPETFFQIVKMYAQTRRNCWGYVKSCTFKIQFGRVNIVSCSQWRPWNVTSEQRSILWMDQHFGVICQRNSPVGKLADPLIKYSLIAYLWLHPLYFACAEAHTKISGIVNAHCMHASTRSSSYSCWTTQAHWNCHSAFDDISLHSRTRSEPMC